MPLFALNVHCFFLNLKISLPLSSDLKPIKLANIDEIPNGGIMEVYFKPHHYTIFEDQLMVQATVAREGGNLEETILVTILVTLFQDQE